jgi:hypothetical protein
MTGRPGAWLGPRFAGWLGGPLGRRGAQARALPADPFAVLGMDSGADQTDDDVRAAWRRIAAATHPDRADGGDQERFASAAAAYTDLRTGYGRGEARAVLGQSSGHAAGSGGGPMAGLAIRVARGPVARLTLRVILAMAAATTAVLVSGPSPATAALVTGTATWLVLTSRRDVSAAAGRYPGSGPVATGRDGSADQADQEPT